VKPEKETAVFNVGFSGGVLQIVGFSVALSSVDREENRASLNLAIYPTEKLEQISSPVR
jgi:hypothetical protein